MVNRRHDALVARLRLMIDESQAEEVAQEASLKVLEAIDRVDADFLEPYWFSTARNIAISRLRHIKVRKQVEPLLVAEMEQQIRFDPISQDYVKDWERALMVEAVNAMPPICRNVFIYRKIEERSHKEIAELMGISVNTVQNHLSAGMKFCRQFVSERLESASPEIKPSDLSA